MKHLSILFSLLFLTKIIYAQNSKDISERVKVLELRVNALEKELILNKDNKSPNANGLFDIRYELECEDVTTEILITYYDKEGKPTSGWFKSGWKYMFKTTDIYQQILIQAKAGIIPKKPVTVKIYVNNNLTKSETKKVLSLDGPSCQVNLVDQKN